jgi:hypothetical protein
MQPWHWIILILIIVAVILLLTGHLGFSVG